MLDARLQAHQKGQTSSKDEELAHRPLAVAKEIVNESGVLVCPRH